MNDDFEDRAKQAAGTAGTFAGAMSGGVCLGPFCRSPSWVRSLVPS